MLKITEEELDSIEAKIAIEFKKLEELKYMMPNLFMASVSDLFKSLRDNHKIKSCVNYVSWQPYMREGMCRVLTKDAKTNKLINQVTFEDFYCKNHEKTYNMEQQ